MVLTSFKAFRKGQNFEFLIFYSLKERSPTAAKLFTNPHAVHNLLVLELIGWHKQKRDPKKRRNFENAVSHDFKVKFIDDHFDLLHSDLVFSKKYFLHH